MAYSHQPMNSDTQSWCWGKPSGDLHLLAAGDAAVDAPAIIQNPMHHRVVDGVDRPGEFAAHHIMREIGGQPQIGKAVQQIEHEEQVGRHAVAMGFDMHRDAGLFGKPAPAVELGNAILQPARPDIRLQIDVIGAELGTSSSTGFRSSTDFG